MPNQNYEEHIAENAAGCLLFALGAIIVSTVRAFNALATLPTSGIQVGQYHSGLGMRETVSIPDKNDSNTPMSSAQQAAARRRS